MIFKDLDFFLKNILKTLITIYGSTTFAIIAFFYWSTRYIAYRQYYRYKNKKTYNEN